MVGTYPVSLDIGIKSSPILAKRQTQLVLFKMCHYSKLPKENLLPQPFKSNPIWSHLGGRLSSVVSSEPTILQQWVQIPRTPSHFSICIIEIVMRKGRKRGWDSPIFNPIWSHYTHIPTYAVTNDIFSLAVGWVTLPDGTLIRKASSWASFYK